MNLEVAGSLRRISAIARLTARETLRSRSMVIAVVLNLAYLGLFALVAATALSSERGAALGRVPATFQRDIVRFLLSFAIAGASNLALFVGIFASAGAISNEIERGTILAVAARPVARWEIVAGKFLGNGLLSCAYLVSQGLLVGGAVALLAGYWTNDLLVALALLSLNVLIMVAVAVAGSTRLNTLANAIVIIVLYLALVNTGLLYGIGAFLEDDLLRGIADWSRLLLPVGEVGDMAGRRLAGPFGALAEGELNGRAILLPTRDWISFYAALYLGVVLILAGWSLTRRDLR